MKVVTVSVLLGKVVDDGIIETIITLPEPNESSGAFVVFRAEGQERYFAAGLGGWDNAYTLMEGHHLTPTRLASSGNINNLQANRQYNFKIALDGQRVQIFVDDVKVIDYQRLPSTNREKSKRESKKRKQKKSKRTSI